MRVLNRNKQALWYAVFVSKEEIMDEYGNATGDYKITYSKPVAMRANISAARGTADVEMFGVALAYDKAIVTDDMSCPISETSILWIDTPPALDEDGNTITPHDYVVKRVARSLNSIAYAVSKVDVALAPEPEPEPGEPPPYGDN
jgi:hypothetical protein